MTVSSPEGALASMSPELFLRRTGDEVLLAERAVATPGVLCPETALPFERFFGELERRGIRVAFSEQGQLDD